METSAKTVPMTVHSEIDTEDGMLLTVRSFTSLLEWMQSSERKECSKCQRNKSRMILQRNGAQYKLSSVCETCFARSTWTNSKDWTQPDIIRKFIEGQTVSGIDYWQYKRYYDT